MANYFLDNTDLVYQFGKLDLKEVVELTEENYKQAEKFDYAPVNYDDAVENYKRIMEVVGDIAANYIAPRAASIDEDARA